jgi:hypothetical protein
VALLVHCPSWLLHVQLHVMLNNGLHKCKKLSVEGTMLVLANLRSAMTKDNPANHLHVHVVTQQLPLILADQGTDDDDILQMYISNMLDGLHQLQLE